MELPKSMPYRSMPANSITLYCYYLELLLVKPQRLFVLYPGQSSRLKSKTSSNSWGWPLTPLGESTYIVPNKLGNTYKYLLGNLSNNHQNHIGILYLHNLSSTILESSHWSHNLSYSWSAILCLLLWGFLPELVNGKWSSSLSLPWWTIFPKSVYCEFQICVYL